MEIEFSTNCEQSPVNVTAHEQLWPSFVHTQPPRDSNFVGESYKTGLIIRHTAYLETLKSEELCILGEMKRIRFKTCQGPAYLLPKCCLCHQTLSWWSHIPLRFLDVYQHVS